MMSRWLDSDETTGSSTMIVNGFPDNFLKTVSWTGSVLTITDQENNATEIPINTTNGTNDDPFVAYSADDTETLQTTSLVGEYLKAFSFDSNILTFTDKDDVTSSLQFAPGIVAPIGQDLEETIQSRTLYGFMDVNGDMVRASVGVTSEREAAGKYRIRFPGRNSEFYVVNVTVMLGGQSYTVVVANHAIDNFRFDVRNNSNNYVSRPLSFSITEIDA